MNDDVSSSAACGEEHPVYKVPCDKEAGHDGIHMHIAPASTWSWGFDRGMTIRERSVSQN